MRKVRRDNKTGIVGVHIKYQNNKKYYVASIKKDDRGMTLGVYKTLEEAKYIRQLAEIELEEIDNFSGIIPSDDPRNFKSVKPKTFVYYLMDKYGKYIDE